MRASYRFGIIGDAMKQRTWREKAGLSLDALAALLSEKEGIRVARGTLSRYETGERRPHPRIASAISKLTAGAVTMNDYVS